MKYIGSKARIAKEISAIMLKDRKPGQYFVDLFCGGCNMIDSVTGKRIANDINPYLIALFKAVINGFRPPEFINKEERDSIKKNPEKYNPELVGWAGFACGFGGDFNGGYAGISNTKSGTIRNYQNEAYRGLLKQAKKLEGVEFFNEDYQSVPLPANSIVYCDIPYKGTTGYSNKLDYEIFYTWARANKDNHKIFVSEYDAPEDFICQWQKQLGSQLSANGKSGGNKTSTERLFTL